MKRHTSKKSHTGAHHVLEWVALGTVTLLVGAVLFVQNTNQIAVV